MASLCFWTSYLEHVTLGKCSFVSQHMWAGPLFLLLLSNLLARPARNPSGLILLFWKDLFISEKVRGAGGERKNPKQSPR